MLREEVERQIDMQTAKDEEKRDFHIVLYNGFLLQMISAKPSVS